MKTYFLTLIVVVFAALMVVSCTQREQKTAQTVVQPDVYTCPMHPQIIRDKPGACPICGMELIKKIKAATADSSEIARIQMVSLSPTQRVMANVATAVVGNGDVGREVRAVGVVDVAEPNQAEVVARFGGRIEKLFVNYTGQRVGKGDPLFVLYSPDLLSAIEEFLLAVKSGGEAGDSSSNPMVEASRERLRVRFGMTAAQITQIETGKASKESAVFHSPISGTILSKDIQEGQYVTEGTLLYRLANLSRVWVYLDVYEQDLGRIRLGHPVKMTTEAYPDELFKGTVTFIDPVVNPETRTVRVRAEFANPEGKLKPQMYVSATIHVPGRRSLTVPSSAVLYTGKRTLVWVETEHNMFEPRDVMLGAVSDGRAEVRSGLYEGDQIVVSGNYLLESESQLQQPSGNAGGHQHSSGAGVPNASPQTPPNTEPADKHQGHKM